MIYPAVPLESARQIGGNAFAGAQQARQGRIQLRAGAARALAAKRDTLLQTLGIMRERHTIHKQQEAAARRRRESLGLAAGGTAAGAGAGAIIGSVVPGVGTLAGASIGAGVGGGLGNAAGGNPVAGVQQTAGSLAYGADRLDQFGDPFVDNLFSAVDAAAPPSFPMRFGG